MATHPTRFGKTRWRTPGGSSRGDRTKDFTSFIRTYRKTHGLAKPQSELLQPISRPTPFIAAATTILGSINRTRACLLQQLQEFIEDPSTATVDDAVGFVRACEGQIADLDSSIPTKASSLVLHRKAVVAYLCEKLQGLEGIVEQQATLKKRFVRSSQSRLYTRPVATRSGVGSSGGSSGGAPSLSELPAPTFNLPTSEFMRGASGAQLQELEAENAALLTTLHAEMEEAELIEREMVEVSRLMSTFSEKLVDQQSEIEMLVEEVVYSRDQVAKGNEQLVQATQRTFSFRIFVLCFLIGASFVLLFLDWYNP